MELNGALWNPLEKGKTGLIRLQKLVRDLRRRETPPAQRTLPPRRELVGAAAEEVVCTADAPLRIAEVCAVLRQRGVDANPESVRKALHDRSRGKEARLERVCRGVYAARTYCDRRLSSIELSPDTDADDSGAGLVQDEGRGSPAIGALDAAACQ